MKKRERQLAPSRSNGKHDIPQRSHRISSSNKTLANLALRLLLGAALVAPPLGAILAQTPNELVDQAREAAREDRNEEAVELFARAIETEPGLRDEVLREYADQLTFITQAEQAVPLFRELLAGDPPAEERRRAKRGLALALLRSGQNEEAARAWRTILDADPVDEDARSNLVQALTAQAREAAGADCNARAAELFARAVETVPGRPASLLVEYADQLTFPDNAARAVSIYDEAIASGDLSEEEVSSARRGRALALLWSESYGEAIAA
jgi:tetratricopeptide (TPR) repeat protein